MINKSDTMINQKKISVVIPAYKVVNHILKVIDGIPEFIDHIIVVDDKCPQNSGDFVNEKSNNPKVTVIFNEENKGVGGAVITGYKRAVELNSDIAVKMDGDGQMDPAYLKQLILPIVEGNADYTKGNRFQNFKALRSMPKRRLFGNSMLSFLLKFTSGYWNIMDPTNGYTAIRTATFKGLDFNKISNRYFFESDMLINLNICNAVVMDVPIPAIYGDEESSLNIGNVLLKFPPKLLKGFIKWLVLKYFIYDFNLASLYTLIGLPMLIWGTVFGAYRWIYSIQTGIENTTGTVMLSVLPLILGVQFILQAISIDIGSVPKK
jgi:glycosyltransferase involved in cell wall biosynthesis